LNDFNLDAHPADHIAGLNDSNRVYELTEGLLRPVIRVRTLRSRWRVPSSGLFSKSGCCLGAWTVLNELAVARLPSA